MKIEGRRVVLRDRQPEDFDDYLRWLQPDQEWQNWDAPWEAVEPLLAEARVGWVGQLQLDEPLPEPRRRMEIETIDGRHVGWVTCSPDSWGHDLDVGIDICEDVRGQGLGTEALQLWIDYQFAARPALPHLGLNTWSGNTRVQRVAEKLGLRPEGCIPGVRPWQGRMWDSVHWGVTRAEWQRYGAPAADGLRRIVPADFADSVELIRQLLQHADGENGAPVNGRAAAQAAFSAWWRKRDTLLWTWREAGQVVGLAEARCDGACFLEALVVREDRRGRGIGWRMVVNVEKELRALGEPGLQLATVVPPQELNLRFEMVCGREHFYYRAPLHGVD